MIKYVSAVLQLESIMEITVKLRINNGDNSYTQNQ